MGELELLIEKAKAENDINRKLWVFHHNRVQKELVIFLYPLGYKKSRELRFATWLTDDVEINEACRFIEDNLDKN